eukprot:7382766-Prymnesium_polylepis.2
MSDRPAVRPSALSARVRGSRWQRGLHKSGETITRRLTTGRPTGPSASRCTLPRAVTQRHAWMLCMLHVAPGAPRTDVGNGGTLTASDGNARRERDRRCNPRAGFWAQRAQPQTGALGR